MRSKFVLAASQEAVKSTMSFQIGAVAVQGGRIVARAYNNNRVMRVRGMTARAHAECELLGKLETSSTCGTRQRKKRPLRGYLHSARSSRWQL